jgi:hypothetical protein
MPPKAGYGCPNAVTRRAGRSLARRRKPRLLSGLEVGRPR